MTFKELEQLYQDTQTELADYVIEVSQSERLTVAEKVEKINVYTNKTLSKLGKATEGLDLEINKEYERAVKQQTEALAKRLADAGIDKDIVDVLDENGEINLEALKSNVSMNLNSALNGAKQSVSTIASANRLSTAMEETLAKVQSIEEIAQRLSNGIPAVQYLRSNTVVEVSLGGYAKMVLNDLGVTLDDIASINVAQANGYDLVLMSSHYGTCPICQPYQGRVFSLTGNTKDYPYLYDTGWSETFQNFHPNCRHYLMPFVEDMYSQEELEKYKEFSNRSFEIGGEGWTKAQVDKANRSINAYRKDQARKQKIYNDKKQLERYQARLGDAAPKSYKAFIKTKYSGGESWEKLQLEYRFAGIDNKIRQGYPKYMQIKDLPIPKGLETQALNLTDIDSIFKYTDGGIYCSNINCYVATNKLPDNSPFTTQEIQNLSDDLHKKLATMSSPYDIIIYRGTTVDRVTNLKELQNESTQKWIGQKVSIDSFVSTSVMRKTSYTDNDKDVFLSILVPKGEKGAGYVDPISFNALNRRGWGHEYEMILQDHSKFEILDAQKYGGKIFLTLKYEVKV